MLRLDLLKTFSENHPDITVQTVLTDALYGNQKFMDEAIEQTSYWYGFSKSRTERITSILKSSLIYAVINYSC